MGDADLVRGVRRLNVRLVVFDLDGTLVDSRRDIADAANALLVECGATPLSGDAIAGMVGDGAATLVARAFAAAGAPQPADALARFMALYGQRLVAHTRPYAGVTDMLARLAPLATLAVLTNKPLEATRTLLAALDLARYFAADAVLGGDGPLPRKPDPAGLRWLMTWAGCGTDATLMVGDSLVDWNTAKAAGVAACLARYGFGFNGIGEEMLRPGDRIIDRPQELADGLS